MGACCRSDSVRHLLAFEFSSHIPTYLWFASEIVCILKRDFTRRTKFLSSTTLKKSTFKLKNSTNMAVPTNINKNSVQTLPEEIQVKTRLVFI